MKVSVIIPAYNAAQYLAESVHSALQQPETAEVIIVDDGSRDNSLEVAYNLQKEDPRVKVLRHPDGINRGSAETRNVGIRVAQSEYVAFIDADDVFLHGRFALTGKIFEQHPDAEGVYEAVKNLMGPNAVSFSKSVPLGAEPELHMVRKLVAPEDLLTQLIDDPEGIILLQGLCVKRKLFYKSGWFDPNFRIAQDMLLVKKLAAVGNLYPGSLTEPVSLRRIHDQNISFSEFKDRNPTRFLEADTLFKWSLNKKINPKNKNAILRLNYQQFLYRNNFSFGDGTARRKWIWHLLNISPSGIFYKETWKAMPFIGRFI